MRIRSFILTLLLASAALTGCAATDLKAPCPNFGATCTKTPVNGWDAQ